MCIRLVIPGKAEQYRQCRPAEPGGRKECPRQGVVTIVIDSFIDFKSHSVTQFHG